MSLVFKTATKRISMVMQRLVTKVLDRAYYNSPYALRKKLQFLRWASAERKWKAEGLKNNIQLAGFPKKRYLISSYISGIPHEGSLVIDVGSGNGAYANYICSTYGHNVISYDIDKKGIHSLQEKNNLSNLCFTANWDEVVKKAANYKTLIMYFGSTVAYLEVVQIANYIHSIKSGACENLYVGATDTVKAIMPELRSDRGRMAYNYNLRSLWSELGIVELDYSLASEKVESEIWYYQQIIGHA